MYEHFTKIPDYGYNAGWVTPEGVALEVRNHVELQVNYNGTSIKGYEAHNHGFVRIYVVPNNGEFGFENQQDLTPNQRKTMFAIAEASNCTSVYSDTLTAAPTSALK